LNAIIEIKIIIIARAISIRAIFQLDPKTMGIGPIRTTPPPRIEDFFSTCPSGLSISFSYSEKDIVKPKKKNKKLKTNKRTAMKPYRPDPITKGNTIKIPPFTSPY
jgi:hypothetical protein